jgi:hypothetical protein
VFGSLPNTIFVGKLPTIAGKLCAPRNIVFSIRLWKYPGFVL